LEEKIDALANAFETLVSLVLKIPDSFDKKLIELHQKLSILENKIDLITKKSKILEIQNKTSKMTPQPPPPNPSSVKTAQNTELRDKGSIRRDLISELKEIINLRKENKK